MARLTPPKSPIVYDKHHSGCMWGLYSLFEFRHGNSNRKLLSDKKRFKRDVVDDVNIRHRNLVTELDANAKFRGKDERTGKSHDPNMPNEMKLESKDTTKSIHSFSELDCLPKSNRKANNSGNPKQFPHQNPVKKPDEKLEKKKRAKTRRGCGCKNVDFVMKYDEFLKANDVAEAIVNRKLIEGKYLSKDGVNQHSKQLLDALEILNSNKDLFTKLLQDPHSLLVKHIQDLRESQEQKQQAKSSEVNDPEPSEIVLLKPGLRTMEGSSGKSDCRFEEKRVHSDRPAHFSFGDIKKKFRHAMGATRKDPNLIENVRPRSTGEVRLKMKASEISSFDIEKRDKIEKLREFKARIGQENASIGESGNPRRESTSQDNNFFQKEAMNKLSERAISLSEFDFLSPKSPGSQMRFSVIGNSQVSYDRWRIAREQKASFASSLKQRKSEDFSSHTNPKYRALRGDLDEISKNESEEISDPKSSEEATSSENPSSSDGSEKISSDQITDTKSTEEEIEDLASSRMDLSVDDQPSTSSTSSTPSRIRRENSCNDSKDIGESSPISVLEQIFTDVTSSPSNTAQLEANQSNAISEYVKAVLIPKICESDKMLKAVTWQPNQFCGDCKLLFDCVSEVLEEIHNAPLRPFPWLSFAAKKRSFVTLEEEAMKRIGCYLEEESTEMSLDWLVGKDLERSGAWLDLQIDAENIVDEIAEFSLEELIVETIVGELYYV